MGDATFRPQEALLGLGFPSAVQAALSERVLVAPDRYSGVYEQIGIGATVGRADRSSTIGGTIGLKSGPRTVLTPSGTFQVPFALNQFVLSLIAQHAGAAATEVQQGADSTWLQVIDPDQTDLDLLTRFPTMLFDKKDGEPQLHGPVGIQQIVWAFEKGDVAKLEFTPMSLGFRFYDLPAVVTGSATQPPVIRGWLNPTNDALPDKKMFLKVTAFSTPTVTCLMGFGVTPTGAVTFDVIAGLDDEGRPIWAEILDGDSSVPGLPIGTADNRLEVAFLDEADVTALDEYSYLNPIASPVKVSPTQPELTVAAICLEVDGVEIADAESVTVTTTNDLAVVEGGACTAFPGSFKRTGNSLCTIEFERGWTTYRHMAALKRDSKFVVVIKGRSDTETDPAGARDDQFNFVLRFPIAAFADGQEFTTLEGGASDDTESISLTGEPDDSNPQWRLTATTDVETII